MPLTEHCDGRQMNEGPDVNNLFCSWGCSWEMTWDTTCHPMCMTSACNYDNDACLQGMGMRSKTERVSRPSWACCCGLGESVPILFSVHSPRTDARIFARPLQNTSLLRCSPARRRSLSRRRRGKKNPRGLRLVPSFRITPLRASLASPA